MQRNEVKGNLAKLLATENLVVEHRQCETAQFDVDRRVLTLPLWDLATNDVYDMLVGHEVGHALFTPNRDWRVDVDCSMDYVNIVEDARIEKLMKRKYPGLKKSFARGYSELVEQDFFGTEGKDLINYNLIDRINLHYKQGADSLIPFKDEELEFVDAVGNTETFDEVLEVAKRIYDWQTQQNEEQKQDADDLNADNVAAAGEGGKKDLDEMSDEELLEELEQESPAKDPAQLDTPSYEEGAADKSNVQPQPDGNQGGDHNESQTQKSFDQLAKELSRPNAGLHDVTYVEIPKTIDLDTYVTDWTEVHDWIDSQRKDHIKQWESEFTPANVIYKEPDESYRAFRKSSNKEVNYLVKEFESRKSADAYARAGTSRTGVLNTAKLHEYRFNEDIFKRITTIPDGKNHGMIFLLDWSGSMANEILATVKQLISLTSFCKKVQIPFEVYAFSNDWYIAKNSIETGEEIEYYGSHNWYGNYDRQHNNLKEGEFYFDKLQFDLINVISSRSNSKDYERQCLNLFREAWCYRNRCHYQPTAGLGLSGTPLNEAVVMLNYLIPEFKRNNDLQKVNVCILTDGESASATYGRKVRREYVEDYDVRPGRVDYNTCLRDRQTGRVYKPFNGNFSEVTSTFIQQVRDRHPEVSVVGFRILSSRDLSTFVGRYGSRETSYEEVQKQWRKDKSAIIPNPMSFTALYAIANTALDDDAEFEVAQDATKGQITRAFKKMLKTKGSNKKLLSSFIGHVS